MTRPNAPTAYLTEKTLKAILSGSAFLLVGQQQVKARTERLGFRTFDHLFGLPDYDSLEDSRRLGFFVDLAKQTFDYDQDLAQTIVDYNYDYLHYDFQKCMREENLSRVQQILKYIDE